MELGALHVSNQGQSVQTDGNYVRVIDATYYRFDRKSAKNSRTFSYNEHSLPRKNIVRI